MVEYSEEFKKSLPTLEEADEFPNSQSSINLENILLIEDKVWSLLELHRFLERSQTKDTQVIDSKLSEIAFLCDEWWEITHEDSVNHLDKAIRHNQLRRAVRQCLIVILLTITACYATSIEACQDKDEEGQQSPNLSIGFLSRAKKLLFYAHQSFLILTELILYKLPKHSSHNLWAHSLQAIILNKKCRVQENQKQTQLELES